MSEPALTDMLTPEEAMKHNVPCVCLVLDEDIVKGIERLKDIFPIGVLISNSLRPFINTFLPIADLHEQGKLTADCLPEIMKDLESLIIRADVAKARLDKNVKKLEKDKKNELRSKG